MFCRIGGRGCQEGFGDGLSSGEKKRWASLMEKTPAAEGEMEHVAGLLVAVSWFTGKRRPKEGCRLD
jgi:hypothetical protein